jgi:hypothetical protein
MSDTSDVERADRLGRTRARVFAVQGVLFLAWQTMYLTDRAGHSTANVPTFKISAWLVWVVLLLFLLATGGMLLRGRDVRHLLNDELTRMNRARAVAVGFWAAALAGIALYIVAMFEPVAGREAIHVILSAAIGAALITFAKLERRTADSS